jgi:gamma-glutamyl hydrolase
MLFVAVTQIPRLPKILRIRCEKEANEEKHFYFAKTILVFFPPALKYSIFLPQMAGGFRMLLLCAIVIVVVTGYPTQPQNPVMGILVEPAAYSNNACVSVFSHKSRRSGDPTMPPGNLSGCVWSIYVKWLESAGIRVVPIRWNSKVEDIDYLLDRVNGVLLPGGIIEGDKPVYDAYFATVQHIFNRITYFNTQQGNPVVLWGTCQGFEMINAAAAGTLSVILPGFEGMDPLMMKVNFTDAASKSRMFGEAPEYVLSAMAQRDTTLNWHNKGITPQEYATNTKLSSTLRPLSTTNDVNGRTFISSLEGISAAIYATQFHPERPPYEFDDDLIGHGEDALHVSNYLSLFLREQLMKNNHTFEDPSLLNRLTIENYAMANQGFGIQVYYV